MNITISLLCLIAALVCELIATFRPDLGKINWMTFGFAFVIASVLVTGALTIAPK